MAVVDRPPDIPYSSLIDSEFIPDLRKYSLGYDYRIVMADLNANMISTAQDATFIKELACELNLKLVDHGAANHVRDSDTCINVIFTNDDNVVLIATIPNSHKIIDVAIDFQSMNPPRTRGSALREEFQFIAAVAGKRTYLMP